MGTRRTALALLAALGSAGCEMMAVPTYPVRPVHEYSDAIVRGDLSVAFLPISDSEAWHHFHLEMHRDHLLAVIVVAENRSADRSYLLARDAVKVALGGTDLAAPDHGVPSRRAAEGLVGMGLLSASAVVLGPAMVGLLPIFGAFGFQEASDETVIRAGLEDAQLWRTTLSPGETAHGFAYFQLPESLLGKVSAVVTAELRPLSEGNAETFTLPFAFEVE